MNQLKSAAAMLFLASNLSLPVWAESRDRMGPQRMQDRQEKREEKMLERLTKKLSLTDDQQKSVAALLDMQGEKLESLNKEYMVKRKALHEETDGQITKALNDDQKQKFNEWKSEKKERFEDRKERLGDRKK